jgi:hypothetical protein
MARALQCPDCGHREPLDNVVDFDQFRCHGCGRALKVPTELRAAGESGDERSASPVPATPTPATPTPATPTPPTEVVAGSEESGSNAVESPAASGTQTRVLARASETDLLPNATSPSGDRPLSRVERAARVAATPRERLPLAARLAVWVLWLPIGLGFTYLVAIKLDWITQDDLIETVGEVTWDRFMPIARIIPLAALLVALLVHGTNVALERWFGNRRRKRITSPVAAEPK